MLQDWKLAAPADEGALVGLLSRWATRGRQDSPEPQVLPPVLPSLLPPLNFPKQLPSRATARCHLSAKLYPTSAHWPF